MNLSRNQLAMGALGVLVIVTILTAVAGFSFSVIVMANIAAVAFMTVLVVMQMGLQHGFTPTTVDDSPANRHLDGAGSPIARNSRRHRENGSIR